EAHGSLLTGLRRPKEGVLGFRRSLALREQLASSVQNASWQRELENAYRRARDGLLKGDQPVEALETAEQQLFATSLAIDSEPGKVKRVARALVSLSWTALVAQSTERAVWAARQALALVPDYQTAKLNYAHGLMYSGDLAGAKKAYLDGLTAGGDGAAGWR